MDVFKASGFCVPAIQQRTVTSCTLTNLAISFTKADLGAIGALLGSAS